jgi:hypothetical protein
VLEADAAPRTFNVLGAPIPTLELGPRLVRPLSVLAGEFYREPVESAPPCSLDATSAGTLLDEAGIQRFKTKADRIEGDLSVLTPSDLLWQGVARALGYTRNADAMTRLSQRVSVARLRTLYGSSRDADPLVTVYAALLGTAGLLPSQCSNRPLGLVGEELEASWLRLQGQGWEAPKTSLDWELKRIRPGNHPVRRLAALAVMSHRMAGEEPLRDLARIVLQDSRPACTLIRRWCVFAPSSDWSRIVDLAHGCGQGTPGLVGRVRAAEIVINAVLPLLHALGRVWSMPDLEEASLNVYRSFPRASATGLARHMAEQIFGAEGYRVATTACRQQGLIHIFRTTCYAHACERCPVRNDRRVMGDC